VSKNGNLLINVGPQADGTISEEQKRPLRGLGAWLTANGEAIYGTRPWVKADTKTSAGHAVRFTKKGDTLYAILLVKEGQAESLGREVVIQDLVLPQGAGTRLLQTGQSLNWKQAGQNAVIELPADLPAALAHTFEISPMP
jgi:alpha-L-fucosidase